MLATGQSLYLARLSGDELVLISSAEPRMGFHISSEVGSRLPLYCTSEGKCILAHMPEARARELLQHRGMSPMTPNTLTSWSDLQTQLELTRELGYAVERGEFRPGLQSVGAPVFDASGACVYAVGLVELQNPNQPTIHRNTIELVKQAAAEVSRKMGWWPGKQHGSAAVNP